VFLGDLGVQRGMLRWFLALHSPDYTITISPLKLPKAPSEDPAPAPVPAADPDALPALAPDGSSVLPAPVPRPAPKRGAKGRGKVKAQAEARTGPGPGANVGAEPPSDAEKGAADTGGVLPAPFTPSIAKTLNMSARRPELALARPPLPAGLTVGGMRTRLEKKTKIK
jgi:DNA-3-methyladenine glycosylase II